MVAEAQPLPVEGLVKRYRLGLPAVGGPWSPIHHHPPMTLITPSTRGFAMPTPRTLSHLARSVDSDLLAQTAVVTVALAQLPTAALGATGRAGTATVQELSDSFDIAVVPAGYAFAVWGPIYAGSLALAGYQALPAHRTNPVLRRVRLPFAAACAGNAAWVLLFTSRRYVPALGAILTTLAGSSLAYARAGSGPPLTPTQAWLVRAPAGALSGWISVATPSGVAITLLSRGHGRLGLGATGWALPVLGAVTGVAAAVTRRLPQSLSYPAAVVWGLAGVAANPRTAPAVRGAAAGGAAVVVATALLPRTTR